jgi:hypothetical protein
MDAQELLLGRTPECSGRMDAQELPAANSVISRLIARYAAILRAPGAPKLPPASRLRAARRSEFAFIGYSSRASKLSGDDIMDDNKALAIVSALANGVNPRTGEIFEVDSPYQSADVIRALYVAVRALEMSNRSKARNNRARMPTNAGKPWTEQEDRELLERFDHGMSVPQLAQAHDRTLAGVQARLERHGRLQGQGLQWRGRSGNAPADSTPGERSS